MNPTLYKALWHLKHWRDKEIFQKLRLVERNQWLSADELNDISWRKQRKIFGHAYENSSFYRKKYDDVGIGPEDLKKPEHFSLIPLLTKKEIRQNLDGMVIDNTPRSQLLTRYTGGSTGIPLKVYHDATSSPTQWAIYMRSIGRWGIGLGDKTAHIWGANQLNEKHLYENQSWFKNRVKNYTLMNAFEMSSSYMDSFAEHLNHFGPDLFIGYTSAVLTFAEHVRKSGRVKLKPKAIWLTSEVTLDSQKEAIEDVFDAPVFVQYGCVENLYCAAECEQREGLHIESDFTTVEVVNEDGRSSQPGEIGQVAITSLTNFAAPLIRYANEDLGNLSEDLCSCGRQLPMMAEINGRIYDMFVLSDGSQIYSHRFTTFFYDHVQAVKTFQIHQKSFDHIEVTVVPTESCNAQTLKTSIIEKFREYTKGQTTFDIHFVKKIPTENSGKFRFTKSDVHNMEHHNSAE